MLVDITGPHFFASDGFTKGRIGTAWKTGKVHDFQFGFLRVDFVLALRAAAQRSYNLHVKI